MVKWNTFCKLCAQLSKNLVLWADAGPWFQAAADTTDTNRTPSASDKAIIQHCLHTHTHTRVLVDIRGKIFTSEAKIWQTINCSYKDKGTLSCKMKELLQKYPTNIFWLINELNPLGVYMSRVCVWERERARARETAWMFAQVFLPPVELNIHWSR